MKATMPIQPELREKMNEVARLLDASLPEGVCFAFFAFDTWPGGFTNYISNAEREDVVRTLREFVEREERVS